MAEYFKIGKFLAAHGVKGELLLQHQLGKKTSLKGLQTIFIEDRKNSFLPWFVESTRIKSNEAVFMKLEGINTREAAINLAQKEAWVTEADIKKFAAKSSPISLLGYEIVTHQKILGNILEVIDQSHQLLCKIEIEKREVLIPLNEDTLKKIDHKNRQVVVNLPDGLLEIYLDR